MLRPAFEVGFGMEPWEGTRGLPATLDFTSNANISDDLTPEQLASQIDFVQSIFIDNSLNQSNVSITFAGLNQKIVCPAQAQGVFPVISPVRCQYTAASAGGVKVPVIFLNQLVNYAVWSSVFLNNVPWAIAPDAYLDFDLVNNRGFQGSSAIAPATSFLTNTRASPAWQWNSSGIYTQVGNTVQRQTDLGALIEDGCTNVCLWCRDLTNAVWTATNITAVKNQTGIDNAANSASSITATLANGTILQAITNASIARQQSAFVKRITGSGVIQMTMDNGATWTNITVTTSWTRVSIPTQTLANPTVGFRIVTNGDAIAVDFVQNEFVTSGIYPAPFPTSPILTTTASFARLADFCSLTTLPPMSVANLSMYCDGQFYAAGSVATTFPTLFNATGTSSSNDGIGFTTQINWSPAGQTGFALIGGTGSNNSPPGTVLSANTPFAQAMAFSTTRTISATNGTLGTASNNQPFGSNSPSGALATLTNIGLGLPFHFQFAPYFFFRRVALWIATTLTDARLQSITTTPF